MKSLLVFPPGWSPVGPYLALPVLKAYMKQVKGIDVCITDQNVEFYDYLLSLKNVTTALENISKLSTGALTKKEKLTIDLIKNSALQVESAKRIFRSEEYYNLDKREYAENIFRNAFYVLNHSKKGLHYSFNSIDLPYKYYSTKDIMEAIGDITINPFIQFYSCGIINRINNSGEEFIGISISGACQMIPALTLAKLIREKCRSVKHVSLGGNYITRIAENTFGFYHPFFEYIDSIMMYDGEEPLAQLIETLDCDGDLRYVSNLYYLNAGKIVKNSIVAQEQINDCVPDFTGFALEKYFMPELVLPIYSSRQCFNHCAFCTIPNATSGHYKTMPISRVYEIMKELNKRYKSRVFSFVDETFEVKRMKELAGILNRNNENFFWHGETRFSPFLTEEDCIEMYKSGCRQIQLGLESYNQRVLDLMKKNIRTEWIDNNISNLLSAGIPVHLFFMIGFPTETMEEAYNTIRYTENVLYQSKTKYNVPYSTRGFDQFGLDIGSDVWRHPDCYGVKPIHNTADFDLRLNVRYETTSGLTPHESRKLVDKYHVDFYLETLALEKIPVELPERLHISEITWILDSAYSVKYDVQRIKTRMLLSIMEGSSLIRMDKSTSYKISDAGVYFYNSKKHTLYITDETILHFIENISNSAVPVRNIRDYQALSTQRNIEGLLFYGMLYSDNKQNGYIDNFFDSQLILNPLVQEIGVEENGMHTLLSLGSYKMCRVNSFCMALLKTFKNPIRPDKIAYTLKQSGVDLELNEFQIFLDKCVRYDVIHVVDKMSQSN